MKKRILPLLTVLLLAVLMTVAVLADGTSAPSLAIVPAVTDTLEEGDTFDVYIVVTPFEKIGSTASANYVYRVPEDVKAGKVPNNNNNDLTNMLFTVNWDKDSLEAYHVVTFEGNELSTTDQDAGNGYKYAALATSTTVAVVPTVTGDGTGANNTGVLTVDYGTTVAGGFLIRGETATPNGVVAKITFRVVAGAEGGNNTITLDNSYNYAGTAYSATQTSVAVNVAAGCAHASKVALTPAQLAEAGLENSAATCIKEDITWYYCSDCMQNIKVSTGVLFPHNYTIEKFVIGSEPNCAEGGLKAMYCSVDPDCTAHDPATETPVNKLGHDFDGDAQHIFATADCTNDGYDFYVCARCQHVSKDGQSILRVTYDGSVFVNVDTRREVEMPADFVIKATGHDWVYDRTESGYRYYKCANNCGIEEKKVAISDTVRYVSNAGGGDGSSATSTVTLAQAFAAFQDIPADMDCTIYLVGLVDLAQNHVSDCYTFTKGFEEYPHEATVTITTAPGTAKATLRFYENDKSTGVSVYSLYGPTVFDNVKFASTAQGSTVGTSPSATITARGFELTMTENVEMVSSGSGISYSKEGGSFAYAVDMTWNIPDVKMYIVGGFYDGSGGAAYYDGYDTTAATHNAVLNVYGGTYWVVAGSTRSANATLNSNITINLGGSAKVAQLIPITTTAANNTGTVVNINYYSGFQSLYAYRANNTTTTGLYTVNHFFHKGSGNMQIGDFMMGAKNNHPRNVNVYYHEFDAAAYNMGVAVAEKGFANDVEYDLYRGGGSQEAMTFTEWCVTYGGGHDYVNKECTFCGVTKCSVHDFETVVNKEPTCKDEGEVVKFCTVCYEQVGEPEPIPVDPNAHNYVWDNITAENLTFTCEYCGHTGTYAGENTGVIYVSDNGKGNGGFSADYPINDYEKAYQLAAAYDGDATIYVVGTVNVKANNKQTSSHTVFIEPTHENTITVRGYKNSGLIKFVGTTSSGKTIYALNGDTTFHDVEFSNGVTKATDGFMYLVAQHNHLTLGENVSVDYMRNTNARLNTCLMLVLGGCYHYNYTSTSTSVQAANCPGSENHVTIMSGAYYEFLGGSVGGTCSTVNGTINIEILGDVNFRDYFAGGSFERNTGDINITIDGNVSTGGYTTTSATTGTNHGGFFSFAGVNNAGNADTSGLAKNVTVKLLGGSIHSNNFEASNDYVTIRPVGASRYTSTGVVDTTYGDFDITMLLDSLTVCYNPASGSAKDTYNHIMSAAAMATKTVEVKIISDNFCNVTANGVHVIGSVVEEVPSTCAKQGYGTYVCSECSVQYTEPLDAVAHIYGDMDVASEANCINPKIMKEVCTECGFIKYSVGDEPATGVHEYEDGVCVHCSLSLQDVCEHVWDAGVAISTGCGAGVKYTCTNGCGKTFVEETSAVHNYGKYTITVEPTETEAGVKTRTCKSCGKVDTALIYADGSAANNEAIAVDANGALADVEIAVSKLTSAEKAVINALLQETAYGSEVKVSYDVEGNVTGITYSIPLPAEYEGMTNLQVIVKDDDGTLHAVQFTVEKGYIVFTF